jgi:hypothetical protein
VIYLLFGFLLPAFFGAIAFNIELKFIFTTL